MTLPKLLIKFVVTTHGYSSLLSSCINCQRSVCSFTVLNVTLNEKIVFFNIQSEQEKKLLKQVRKEERKVCRRDNAEDLENHEDYLKAVGFDPETMKYKRYLFQNHPQRYMNGTF